MHRLCCLIAGFTGIAYAVVSEERERRAFIEGQDTAIDNAAMKAYDMGRPDIREAINQLTECNTFRANAAKPKPSTKAQKSHNAKGGRNG